MHTNNWTLLQRRCWSMGKCFRNSSFSYGDYLIVGIHADAVVNSHRGLNYPLMSVHERALSVLGCKVPLSLLPPLTPPLPFAPRVGSVRGRRAPGRAILHHKNDDRFLEDLCCGSWLLTLGWTSQRARNGTLWMTSIAMRCLPPKGLVGNEQQSQWQWQQQRAEQRTLSRGRWGSCMT
jgi:hypothetical protein